MTKWKWWSLAMLLAGAAVMTGRTISPPESSVSALWSGFIWGVLAVLYLRDLAAK